jgi:predicted helicase
MADVFDGYLKDINAAYQRGDATEHTHRPALKTLLESLGKHITATNDPKRIACGAPDYSVSRKEGRLDKTIGYVEAKDIGSDLKTILKSEQIKRYLGSLHSLIVTDYLDFRWYMGGELRMTAVLAKEGKGGKFVATDDSKTQTQEIIGQFLQQEAVPIKNAKDLAGRMAGLARLLHDVIALTFKQEDKGGALHGQFQAFQKVLLHDLKESEFADMYAQTIAYGLFTARCYHKNGDFNRKEAVYDLPKTNPFLRQTFGHIAGAELDERVAWLVDDLASLLRDTQMDLILRDFGKKTKREDPVVHFYETFLAAYDPKLRESRGVYYTPEPVVSYIVRSVDWILREKFGLRQGLADNSKVKLDSRLRGNDKDGRGNDKKESPSAKEVTRSGDASATLEEVHRCLILDPACGTGTFLYEVIRQIREQLGSQKGAWGQYVKEHLLPRVFGFELMMAPYAVCHMKLGLELAESGYDFSSDERLGVYLTNTLEEAEDISGLLGFGQFLSDEAKAANIVKRDLPIMVVLGNPPYSGHSANASEKIIVIEQGIKYTIITKKGKRIEKIAGPKGVKIKKKTFIGNLIQDYYQVDGKPLGEKNPKWLQDDYVKFLRYGQYRIQQTGAGVLAFITNHGYIDNPTFRGMRQQVMQTFSEIYILDLHGNAKKKEVCPDGSEDNNVFDIQQGVSIGIFIKETGKTDEAKVYHADLWGKREGKYDWLNTREIEKTKWKKVKPDKPFYLFCPQDKNLLGEYDTYWKITDVMKVNVLGFQTHRDEFAIAFERKDIEKRIADLRDDSLTEDEIKQKYSLQEQQDWKLSDIRGKIKKLTTWKNAIIKCAYRPFDDRAIFYSQHILDRPRRELLDHVAWKENVCLGLGRQGIAVNDPQWSLISTSRFPVDANIFRRGGINLFPLYLYSTGLFHDESGNWPAGKDGRIPNLSKAFVDELAERVGLGFVSDGRGDFLDSRLRGNDKKESPSAMAKKTDSSPHKGVRNDVPGTFGPEDVFDWIYGVFHSPQYRQRYAEFLKIDFPRVPMPKDKQQFAAVCAIGRQLAALHLMEAEILDDKKLWPVFGEKGTGEVEAGYPKYPDNRRVYINAGQYFEGVEPAVWEFTIGGYQVCEKWLKDRRGRTLSFDDIQHYQKIVVALRETIRLMADEKLRLWKIR